MMVTNDTDGIIWDMLTETSLTDVHPSYYMLDKEIDLQLWKYAYRNLYQEWLNDDGESIYDIGHPVNLNLINSLININKLTLEYKLYYWFDVNRDKYPDFFWETCPISGTPLIALPIYFHRNNRKISQLFPLVFPG